MEEAEQKLLVEAAQEMGRSIAIRGSTAAAYVGRDVDHTLVECVPPLGDLDVVLGAPKGGTRTDTGVVERLRTELPAYRFIHIDVVYADALGAGDSAVGNVALKGLPEVAVGLNGELRETSGENVAADVREAVPGTLFRDFLYLLRISRRYDALDKPLREVVQLLLRHKPEALGRATRILGGGRELMRVDKALVKHALLEEPKEPMTTYLPRRWLLAFAPFLNHISHEVITWEKQWLGSTSVSYSVNGVVKSLRFAAALEDLEWQTVQLKMEPAWELDKGRLSPVVEVALPEARDPDCCDYRDFSKGIAELAFGDFNGGALLDLALMEGTERVHIVHALAGSGRGAKSLRTDPGFMSILAAGGPRRSRVFGVRA